MAILVNPISREQILLRVNHTFGRDKGTNITVLNNSGASRNHASIAWDDAQWKIKDTSRNGTYINNARIPTGEFHELHVNAEIKFGLADNQTWILKCLTPPATGLIPLTQGQEFIPLHDVESLPIKGKQIMVALSELGEWQCETDTDISVLKSGDKVGHDGVFWQFVDARWCPTTEAINSAAPTGIKFCFKSSPNEEHISLKLEINKETIDLGIRNHHYLLLLLAKQRLLDINKGIPESEQGWIKKDLLMRMMGIAEQHINIQVFRFRKQVAKRITSPATLHQVIERRPGELRFAYKDIEIAGGFTELENII